MCYDSAITSGIVSGGEHGLERQDLRHQRRVAAHLARQDVGVRRGRHRRAAGHDQQVGAG